jgi:predicted nucleic acid-binding protein
MLLVDANVFIYAFRRDLPQHTTAKRWLERKLSADELLALSELAFFRTTTNRRAFARAVDI